MKNKSEKTKLSIFINFVGIGWYAILNFVSIPIYVRLLGIEAFGFLGIYNSIWASVVLLDYGVSQALNREIARLKSDAAKVFQIRSLIWSVELLFWAATICICVGVGLLSPIFAEHWVNVESISIADTETVFLLMSLSLFFQFPINLYANCLLGYEKHFHVNIINMFGLTLRFGLTILSLIFIDSNLFVFFFTQAIAGLIHVVVLRVTIERIIKIYNKGTKFSKELILSLKKFAFGMGSMTISEFFLSQFDKFILSALLPMTTFGYYMVAHSLASIITLFSRPIRNVVYPRFSLLIEIKDILSLNNLYHKTSQLSSTLIYPVTFTFYFFSSEILYLWTKDHLISSNASYLLSFIVFGNCFYSILKLPTTLSLAYGWTKPFVYQNFIALLFFIPWLIIYTEDLGAISSPLGWFIINLSFFLITPYIVHKYYLKGQLAKWYFKDNFFSITISFIIPLLISKFWLTEDQDNLLTFSQILISIVSSVILSALIFVDRTSFSTALTKIKTAKTKIIGVNN